MMTNPLKKFLDEQIQGKRMKSLRKGIVHDATKKAAEDEMLPPAAFLSLHGGPSDHPNDVASQRSTPNNHDTTPTTHDDSDSSDSDSGGCVRDSGGGGD